MDGVRRLNHASGSPIEPQTLWKWGPDTGFSDGTTHCPTGQFLILPGLDFPWDDIVVTAPSDGSLVRFDFSLAIAIQSGWVHLADGSCLTPDEEGGGAVRYLLFNSTLP